MSEGSLGELTRDDFASWRGQSFAIRLEEGGEVELKVAEANATGGDSDHREPFSVIFLGPLEPVLPQAIYTLMHEEHGILDLFLVPVGPDRERTGMQYEAIFT